MSMRRTCGAAALAGALALAGACVDPFPGSSINVTFDSQVHRAAVGTEAPDGAQPPANTFYAFYAVQVFPDEDPPQSFHFEVQRFEIVPLLNMSSPCFVELDDGSSPYPGIHVTRVLERIQNDTGIADPLNPPEGTPEGDIIDVLTARQRMAVLPQLQSEVKAVVGFSDNLPPGVHPDFPVAADCAEAADNPGLIPPPECGAVDAEDDLNRQRLANCRLYWEADLARARAQNEAHYPGYAEGTYEGSDKVFTLPLNGRWRGSVTGANPKNAGFLSGAQWFAPSPLDPGTFDAFVMRWQYKDIDGNGEPDYPAGLPELEKSVTGYHYMDGVPVYDVTRGTINVPLAHRTFTAVTGEAAIFPSLDEDNVHF